MATAGGAWAALAEAALLTQNQFVAGVKPEIIKAGQLIPKLPPVEINGPALQWNRENVIPSGAFHAIGDAWTGSEDLDHTQVTLSLAIHGDQKNIDQFVRRRYSNKQDMLDVVVKQTIKGLTHKLEDLILYEATSFTGFHGLVVSGQSLHAGSGTTGGAMSAAKMDELVDLVRVADNEEEMPSMFLAMPRALARRVSQSDRGGTTSYPVINIQQAAGDNKVNVSHQAGSWLGKSIVRSDFMVMTEAISGGAYSAKTGGVTGSVLAFHADSDVGAFLGVGSPMLKMEGPHPREGARGEWLRIDSELAPGIMITKCVARYDGITDVAMTA